MMRPAPEVTVYLCVAPVDGRKPGAADRAGSAT